MRGTELLDKLELVKEEYVEAADRLPTKRKSHWLTWAASAACFCVIFGAAFWFSFHSYESEIPPTQPIDLSRPTQHPTESLPTEDETEQTTEPWDLHFNQVTMAADTARVDGTCMFYERLRPVSVADLLPENCPEITDASAIFSSTGELIELILQTSDATVRISESEFLRCYVLPGERMPSECNGVFFLAFQYSQREQVVLGAEARIHGIYYDFSMECTVDGLEEAKERFQALLEIFSRYEVAPDLSRIRPTQIPEMYNRSLSPSEAATDPDFGAYFLQQLPEGFEEESIRKFRDQSSFFLSGLWTKGLDQLSWRVSYCGEADEARVTSVEDLENYDVSLYPIPRAESVPEELWEIVNDPIFRAEELTLDAVYARAYRVSDRGDTDGWRMQFTVKYGNILVHINTKGVEPEWIYKRLMELLPG